MPEKVVIQIISKQRTIVTHPHGGVVAGTNMQLAILKGDGIVDVQLKLFFSKDVATMGPIVTNRPQRRVKDRFVKLVRPRQFPLRCPGQYQRGAREQ